MTWSWERLACPHYMHALLPCLLWKTKSPVYDQWGHVSMSFVQPLTFKIAMEAQQLACPPSCFSLSSSMCRPIETTRIAIRNALHQFSLRRALANWSVTIPLAPDEQGSPFPWNMRAQSFRYHFTQPSLFRKSWSCDQPISHTGKARLKGLSDSSMISSAFTVDARRKLDSRIVGAIECPP